MKAILLISLGLSSVVFAATEGAFTPIRPSAEIESSCRVKAKEIAAETYRTCVTDQKNAQIEQIKKEYAAKLQALKAHYDAELKKMNATKAKASAEEVEAAPEKIEAPTKKKSEAVKPKKVTTGKKVGKKVAKKEAEVTEMTVQLKPASKAPLADDSEMDIPEPIPVDDSVITDESAI